MCASVCAVSKKTGSAPVAGFSVEWRTRHSPVYSRRKESERQVAFWIRASRPYYFAALSATGILFTMPTYPHRSAGVTTAATLALLVSAGALLVWGNFFLNLLNATDSQGRHVYQFFPVQFALLAFLPPAFIAMGVRTGVGLFQLKPWARLRALMWASIALASCLALIAFRPFETFFIPDHFVSDAQAFEQLLAVSFVIMLMPISVWWLFYFRAASVKAQFGVAKPQAMPQPGAVASSD
jgi:hypothetical protein